VKDRWESPEFRIMKKWRTVAIVGVGLIGGSIGLALRRGKLAERIVGVGRRPHTLKKARALGAIDIGTTHVAQGVAEAELVVVCTPLECVVASVREVAAHCPRHALVTDVGSIKGPIVAALERPPATPGGAGRRRNGRSASAARDGEPAGPVFIGSHPLAGSEKTGPEHARASLFKGRVTIITPTRRTRGKDLASITEFWTSLGSTVVTMSPERHDEAVSAVSHLPHLVASALAAATPANRLWLAATGWQDTTRVAAGDIALWRDILLGNREHVLKSLRRFAKVLGMLRRSLSSKDAAQLERILLAGKRNRDAVGN
jgi:prephenate dehydrogenase